MMKFFTVIIFIALISCNKSDFTVEDSLIHVFSSAAKLTKQTYDEGIIAFAYDGKGSQAVIYRINSEGSKTWSRDITEFYSSHANLSITALAPASDGGCLVAGNFFVDTSTYYRSVLFLLRLDHDGQVSFESSTDTLLTAGSQRFEDIVQTSDGGWAAIVGRNNHFYLHRYDPSGNFISDSQLENAEYYKKLIETSDHGFAALGYAPHGFSIISAGFFLCKTDAAGAGQWAKPIYGIYITNTMPEDTVTTMVSDIIEIPSSEFLVSGHSSFLNGSDSHDFDFFITKLSASGDTLLTKTFSNPYNDYSKRIILTKDNNVLISGSESTLPYDINQPGFYRINSSSRCFVIKINSGLQQIWAKSYGNGFGSDGLLTVERSDGSYLICGNQVSFGNKNALSLFTLQVLKNGNLP